MTNEEVVLVDANDNVIGNMEKLRAHELGLLHRAFSVFIFNDQQQLLLQQRQQDKYHCGGLWTNTCCSHPRVGESVVAAAQRRLQEEMGFVVPLQEVGTFTYRAQFSNGLTEHEFDHVLVGQYSGEQIELNKAEVQDYKWISVPNLLQQIQNAPQLFTPWLSLALERIDNA